MTAHSRVCAVVLATVWMLAGASPMAATTHLAVACDAHGGSLYEVGPGQAYAELGEVPFESLAAGDTVRVHWRAQPYRSKILLRRSGTTAAPITLCGLRGPGGERPVIDGENASTRASMGYRVAGTEVRGLIHVSWGAGDAWGYKPEYVVIQGLAIRNAFHEYSFTRADGAQVSYNANAAGIFVERGEHITARDVEISGNGNGFFVASGDSEEMLSRAILIERSELFGNGTVTTGFDRNHNLYTEAAGMTIQFNRFGPLRAGSGGIAIKDRSAGTVVRWNWVEGGARSLDLVEAEDSWPIMHLEPDYHRAFVYGNVLISNPGDAAAFVHYGGDNGDYDTYRKGTLHFFHNTLVMRSNQSGANGRWRSVVFDIPTNDEHVDARNNVIFVRPATPGADPTQLQWMIQYGQLDLGVNWASPTVVAWRDGITPQGTITGLGNVLTNPANDPGFADEAADDFMPTASADLIDAGQALAPEVIAAGHAVELQYRTPADSEPRPDDGAPDLGAFEYDEPDPDRIFADGFEGAG